jgi:flagellar FliL protein
MAEPEEGEKPKKKSAIVPLIIGLLVLTGVGGGGGWVVGKMLAPKVAAAEKAQEAEAKPPEGKKGEDAALPVIDPKTNGIVQLDPITSNLAYPSENWLRLEVALVFKGPTDVKMAEDIHQDILAYVRTVSLQQIEGPRGFQYLRDDIQERVDQRSEGRVSKVMFRTFIIE